jgi:hypothetical protein
MFNFADVKYKVIAYSRTPLKTKLEKIKHCQLSDFPTDEEETTKETLARLMERDIV